MLWEITGALRGMLAVTLLYGFKERIFTFAEQRFHADVPCRISEANYGWVFVPPLDGCKMVGEYLRM